MKKLILILAVALSLSACKKEQINESIIGKWKRNDANVTMTLNDDKTIVQVSNEPLYSSFSGNYRIENNTLIVDMSSPTTGSVTVGQIVTITKTTLTLKALYKFSYTRIN